MTIESSCSGCSNYKKENSYNSLHVKCLHIFFSQVWIGYENGRTLADGLPKTQMGQMPSFQIWEAYNAEQTYSCSHSYPCYVI